ncbi:MULTISPECIES: AIPR family protein [unclassified Streptomyces]|uniref:AIPR family protein n=2 Tax=Streptomyces odorifer TaxID=53450 RepID=A0A7Y6CE23_9ACTN|nr:AIPR family protein [Streptomyces odorifer]NUV38044.1 AIPR family protein [Streptomyces sp. KAI-27]NUV48503.1 AIPR family protein [Streptomyces sp. CAI-78]
MPSNAQTLILRIFEAWKEENLPAVDGGTAFEVFSSELALRSFGLGIEEIQAGIVGGGQDGAIDSVYVFFDDALLDEDSDVVSETSRPSDFGQDRNLELWVVQAKRTPSFAEDVAEKLENTMRRLLDLSLSIESLSVLYNPTLLTRFGIFRNAWEKLITRRPRISVNVIYATPGDSGNITPQFEAKLNALRQVIVSSVPDARAASVQLLGDKELLARYNERPPYTLAMNYQESATSGESHVAIVKLRDYYNLIVDDNGRLRRHLFEWNVRDYQGNVSVNQEIRQSLTSPDSPEFWWLNNGVTIICSDATSTAKTYSLSNIQIVNGLQTSHEIFETLRGGDSAEAGERMLLVRIIVTGDAATRDLVIRATNRQTAITDASLRATDEVQRNIENYFLTQGWYYDRRKGYYKNDGKDPAKIVSIQFLGASVTAMGLARPDKSRGKPSSLLKNDEDYRLVFNSSIDLQVYLWAARLQRQVDSFILSEAAEANVSQKSNLKFHLSMLIVDLLNGAPVRRPQQLRALSSANAAVDDAVLKDLFEKLKEWSNVYLRREGVILERATKAQRFSEYLLDRARDLRESTFSL